MYIPSVEEMEQAIPIPSVAEMEIAVASKKPPKVPKPKPPCKYGPRDEYGYCPKKPAAEKGSSRSSSGGKPCKYGDRLEDGSCPPKPKTQKQLNAQAKRQVKTAQAIAKAAAETNTGQAAIAAAIKAAQAGKAVVKGGDIGKIASAGGAAAAGAIATTSALVLAAGTAAFLGTQWIRKQIDDKNARDRYQKSPEKMFKDAETAYKNARTMIEKDLGRKMNAEEDHHLFKRFMEPIEPTIMQYLRNLQ